MLFIVLMLCLDKYITNASRKRVASQDARVVTSATVTSPLCHALSPGYYGIAEETRRGCMTKCNSRMMSGVGGRKGGGTIQLALKLNVTE